MASVVNIGTSGWSYKHWSGVFYPEDLKPEKYLEFYTNHFSCVELNSCFYHLPLKNTVRGWLNRTPDNFMFCPKLSRYITHQQQLINIEEPLWKFFDVFEEMKHKLGPVLVQLPPGLHYNRNLIEGFIHLVKEQYMSYRFAFEVWNKSWINDEFFSLLNTNNMAFVIADSGNRYPYNETLTSDFVYLRFHGREHLYATDYSDEELGDFAYKIRGWMNEDKEVWAFFNNDYNGFAVKNAARLKEMISIVR